MTTTADADVAVRSARLPSLTSLRWFAASLVFLSHIQDSMTKKLNSPFKHIALQGSSGVSFFFILSGFVLVWSHRESTTKWVFYRRRFARIYPAYALVAVVAIPLLIWLHAITRPVGAARSVLPLTLLQSWIPKNDIAYAGNGVSWSLSCEVFFYAVFPFIVGPIVRASRRAKLVLIGIGLGAPWLFGFALRPTALGSMRFHLLYTWPPARIFEFIAGIALGALLRSGFRVAWLRVWLAVAVATGAYVAAGWAPLYLQAIPITVIPYALLIFAAAQADAAGRTPRLLGARWLIKLGQWSYAFYLVHQLVIRVLAGRYERPGHHPWAEIVAYVLSVAVSGLVYKFIEHPLERRLRPKGPR